MYELYAQGTIHANTSVSSQPQCEIVLWDRLATVNMNVRPASPSPEGAEDVDEADMGALQHVRAVTEMTSVYWVR